MTDIASFLKTLPGTWRLDRRMGDVGHFEGLALIKPTEEKGTYTYREEGRMLTHSDEHEGYRSFIYKISKNTIDILFDDPHRKGTPYVCLEFGKKLNANDIYFCGDDIYGHIFEVISDDHFTTETVVSGPYKDYKLIAHYRRL